MISTRARTDIDLGTMARLGGQRRQFLRFNCIRNQGNPVEDTVFDNPPLNFEA